MTKLMCLMSLIAVNLPAFASEEPIDYLPTESNVRYQQVTELGFRQATKKLVYGSDNPSLQYGLLWLPEDAKPKEKAPLVVLIHGGCWLNAFDIKHTFPLSTALTQAGYAVWSLEYRRAGDPGGGWPGSFDDIKKGLAFTTKLGEYPVNLTRMVVAGHSAGGHLALLASSEIQNITAVIGLAAITDIVRYSQGANSCQTATLDFMGGDHLSDPVAYQLANPVGKKPHPNTTLLQGDIDVIVPVQQATLAGANADILNGAGHFDWVHPGTAAYLRFVDKLSEVTKP